MSGIPDHTGTNSGPDAGGPSGAEILRSRRRALETLWQRGISGGALLAEHTGLMDVYLAESFSGCKEAGNDFALVALGGYGRGELFPFSDIDLLLLYAPEASDRLETVAGAILYPLWDTGLEVGHSVRTPAACLEDAAEDFFFRVSLLDARLLAGSDELFGALTDAFQREFIEGRRHEFLRAMIKQRESRYQRFGKHSYLLEPHVKECRGGFRDIQAMLWTARVVFGLKGLSALREAGLFNENEKLAFAEARDNLIRIRNQLHYVSGRKNDQLYFEHQEEISRAFQYRDYEGILAVEHFMRTLYGHMQVIAVTTDLFFEHVEDALPGVSPKEKEEKVLEEGIELRQGRLHLVEPALLARRPYLMLRLFAHATVTGRPLHYRTRKQIGEHLYLIDDHWRRSRLMARAFYEVLEAEGDILPVLETMLETGLLSAYLPELTRVESLAQHDVYHVYTVDSHLLHTVDHLHRLRSEEKAIFNQVASPHLLFLGGLLHDIGKGAGQDHSERGARLAEAIGGRLGLTAEDRRTLAFLVREHLFLADTALRRDLEDEGFVRRCADRVGTTDRLAMLYLLSIADARATGPGSWNDWKAALLLELYLRLAHVLEQPGPETSEVGPGADWLRRKLAEEMPAGSTGIEIESLPADYLLGFSLEQVSEHLQLHGRLKDETVLVVPTGQKNCWSLLIMTRDQPGLLARICGVVALHNLKVLTAKIFTWPDGTVVDELQVRPLVDETFADHDWQSFGQDLQLAVDQRLGLDHRLSAKLPPAGRSGSQMVNRFQTKVVLDNETSDRHTVVEVYTDDRPGLLYDITRSLSDFGLNICLARIGSRADQVVDVFYLQDGNRRKIDDAEFLDEIRQSLLHVATRTGNRR